MYEFPYKMIKNVSSIIGLVWRDLKPALIKIDYIIFATVLFVYCMLPMK